MAVEEKIEEKVVSQVDDLAAPEEVIDEPLVEPESKPEPDPKVHPLQPGGIRFEQVYAKSKQAERDLVKERELRIAAEAKLEALGSTKPQTVQAEEDIEYDWNQLEQFIVQGRITRADAEAHREKVITKRLAKTIKGDFTKETQTAGRSQALSASITEYVKAVPAILTEGTVERERLDQEFEWLASVQGLDSSKMDDISRKALQLTALRNVHGPIDSLNKRSAAQLKTETHQGLPGGARPQPSNNPDQSLLDGLSKAQVAHYNKMFRAGRYPGGWKEVVAELKFEAPKKGSR